LTNNDFLKLVFAEFVVILALALPCHEVYGHALYEARPQSKFPTRPAARKPYIARSDCAYVIEQ
jgi:hypothetical protein